MNKSPPKPKYIEEPVSFNKQLVADENFEDSVHEIMYMPLPEKKDISKISVMRPIETMKKSSGKKKKHHDRNSNDKTPER